MRVWNKFLYSANPQEITKLGMQVEQVRCFHCGEVTRVAVKEDVTDWKAVAESYRQALQSQADGFDRIVRDVSVMHGQNPILDYIENEFEALRQRLRGDLEKPIDLED